MIQTAFQDDPVDFYVSDNGTNDALAQVNMLICYMTSMAPDKMVNRGRQLLKIEKDQWRWNLPCMGNLQCLFQM